MVVLGDNIIKTIKYNGKKNKMNLLQNSKFLAIWIANQLHKYSQKKILQ